MKVIIDLCVVPLGAGLSVYRFVAACESIIKCREVIHEMGAPCITTTIKAGARVDRQQSMQD